MTRPSKRKSAKQARATTQRQVEGRVQSVAGRFYPPGIVAMLHPWREVGGPVQKRELRIEAPRASMTDGASNRLHRQWHGKVIAIRIQKVGRKTRNTLEKNVVQGRFKCVEPKGELATAIGIQTEEKVYKSRLLGELVLEREYGCLDGERKGAKGRYLLSIDVPDADNDARIRNAIQRGEELVRRLESRIPKLREALVRGSYKLYLEHWVGDTSPMSQTRFGRDFSPGPLHIQKGAISWSWSSKSELFGDHAVKLELSPRLAVKVCSLW